MMNLENKKPINQKQSNLINYARGLGVVIDDIENYANKESVIHCRCGNGHLIQGSIDYLLKTKEGEKSLNIFVYIDPPYKPVTQDENEVSYISVGFGDNEQEKRFPRHFRGFIRCT